MSKQESAVILHQGIFRKQISTFEGVALIVSGTIGAGVLGMPYAIAKVGLLLGVAYIVFIGALMMGLHLLLGQIATQTQGNFQLVGLARKYLGRGGELVMTVLFYLVGLGVLEVYIVGQGHALSTLLGGSEFFWSICFWAIGSLLVYYGLRTVKVADFILSMLILCVILVVSFFSVPHVKVANWQYTNLANMFLPYGVVLFAYSGMAAVLEAYNLLRDNKLVFKKVIIAAGLIVMCVYLFFVFAVLGVTGVNTTEIATIGLGQKIGPAMFVFGNLFAFLAMSTGFLMVGLSARNSLCWDHKLSPLLSTGLVCGLPLAVFLLGLRQFVSAIDFIGGVFLSIEMIMVILIYLRAKRKGDVRSSGYQIHHGLLLAIALFWFLFFGAIYSCAKLIG